MPTTKTARRALCAGAAAALAALAPAAPAGAAPDQESVFQEDRLLLFSDGGTRARALNEIDSLGADTIHTLAFWNRIAPAAEQSDKPSGFDGSDPAAYPASAWDPWDELIAGAKARGLDVLLSPTTRIPSWAAGPGCGSSLNSRIACKPDVDEFRAFVAALGKRYSGSYRDENSGGGTLPRVERWSFANEVNLGSWLTPQYIRRRGRTVAYSPHYYRRLVVAAIDALRDTGHGGDQMLLGELAPVGRSTGRLSTRPIAPLPFMRQLLCITSRGRRDRSGDCRRFRRLPVTGVSIHPYNRGGSGSPRSAGKSDEVTAATMSRLTRLLSQAARARSITRAASRQVYVTEFGFQTNPPDTVFGVSLKRQAEYINEAEYLAFRNRSVRSWAQFELEDEPDRDAFQTGIKFVDGQEKPSYQAYRLPIFADRRGSTVRIWGAARPADGPTTVEIQRGKGGSFETVKTVQVSNPRGYFQTSVGYRSGLRYRLSWNGFFSREAAAR